MRKLTRQSLDELSRMLPVIDAREMHSLIGGGDGTKVSPYTESEYDDMCLNGNWCGGYVLFGDTVEYVVAAAYCEDDSDADGSTSSWTGGSSGYSNDYSFGDEASPGGVADSSSSACDDSFYGYSCTSGTSDNPDDGCSDYWYGYEGEGYGYGDEGYGYDDGVPGSGGGGGSYVIIGGGGGGYNGGGDGGGTQSTPYKNYVFEGISLDEQRRIKEFIDSLPTVFANLSIKITSSDIDVAGNYLNGVITLDRDANDGKLEIGALIEELVHALQDKKNGNNYNYMNSHRSEIEYQAKILSYLMVYSKGKIAEAPFSDSDSHGNSFLVYCFNDDNSFNKEYFIQHVNEYYNEWVSGEREKGNAIEYGTQTSGYHWNWDAYLADIGL